MTRVVLRNVAHVVTVDDHDTLLTNTTVTIDDGTITAITPASEATPDDATRLNDHPSTQEKAEAGSSGRPLAGTGGSATERQRGSADGLRPPDDPDPADPADPAGPQDTLVIDGRGKLLMPGLVNLHTHLPMTLLRGLAEDVDLQGFLARVWAAEGAVMDEETVELGATLGALESLLGGCTTQLDMYFHHEAAHRGAVAAGSRHVIGPVFFDFPGPDGLEWEQRLDRMRAWPAALEATGGPEVPLAAMPHSTYTCGPDHLAEVVTTLRETAGTAGAHRTLLTTHVSENAAENADVAERYAATPTEVLAGAGWLDGDVPLVVGHGVHLSPSDVGALAAAGAAVGHCPGSNLKLASGALAWEDTRARGLRVGLGTDGCSSSNDLDLWQAMRQAALLARLTSGRPDVASAHEVLRAATIEGARALGLGDLVGSVEVGKRADLVLLDLERPHLTPVHDVPALLVFAAGRADVTDVLVDGEVVVRDGRSTRVDTPRLLAAARARGEVARHAAEEAS